jgi:hypothetical protein
VTLEISRAECNIDVTPGTLTTTDTCIGYHVTRSEASRKVILHTRYVSTCVEVGGGRGRGTKIITKANRCGACYLTCDMYKSSLRHIHDPVLSSLKMKGRPIRLLFFNLSARKKCVINATSWTTLRQGKRPGILWRRLGASPGWSERVLKISPPPGFDPRTV